MTVLDAPPRSAPPDGRRRTGTGGSRLRSLRHRLDVTAMPYVLIAPFFVIFAVFGAFPLLYTAYISTTAWSPRRAGSEGEFVGLDNYRALWDDENFWNALTNTFGIGFFSTVPQLVLALWIAHLLNYRLRGRLVLRMGVLLPYVASVVSVSLIFGQLFARDFGLVNWVLGLIDVGPIDWHSGRGPSWTAVSSMVTWRWTGYNALIFLAAMQTIPFELYEAAAIDGAGRLRQFVSVTIPSLRPTIIFAVVVSTIGAMQLFGEPLLFDTTRSANGGADREFQTVVLYLYQQFWFNGRYGYASAIAWALSAVIVVVVAVNLYLARRVRHEN